MLPRDREWRPGHIGRLVKQKKLGLAEEGARQLPLIPPGPKPAQANSVEKTVSACRRRHKPIT